MMNLDAAQLRALSEAVRLGSLDAAARELHVTPSAVSQRIKALEAGVGRVLLVRSRPLAVTDAGAAVLRAARQVEAVAADLAGELAEGTRRRIPLAVSADSLATWVLPALASLDGLLFELYREDEQRTTTLLRDGTVMAAVTSRAEPVAGCRVRPLGVQRYLATAAPAFAARWFPVGPTPDALARAPHLLYDGNDDLQDRYLRAVTPALGRGGPGGPPAHRVPGTHEFATAVRLGLGWAVLLENQVAALGDAVVVIDAARPVDVPLYWQQWKLAGETLETVATAVAAEAGRVLRSPVPKRPSQRRAEEHMSSAPR